MRAANQRIFHPRGLSACICTAAAALKLLGAGPDGVPDDARGALNKMGRGMGRPPPAKTQNAMDTLQAWGVRFDQGMANAQERRRAGRRKELAEKQARLAAMEAGDYERAGMRELYSLRRAQRREQMGKWLKWSLVGPMPGLLEAQVANAEVVDKWEGDDTMWLVTEARRQGDYGDWRGG